MQSQRQFIYVLKLVPRLLTPGNWTPKDNDSVARHFGRLQELLAEGRLILAGKTDGIDESTFGIVVFEAEDEAEARAFMESDPTVVDGVMTATLFPYTVALMRGADSD